MSPHASAASAPAGPTVLPEGSGIPIQADETRAGVADLSVTARTTGIVRSDTLATNARTRGTGPVPSRRGDEHAMREALHQRRIPFRRSPAQADDDDDDEPVQPPDYVIAAAVSCVPGYRISGNARTMPSRGTRSPGPVTGANNAAAVGLVLFKRHDIDDTHSFWSEESTARMQLGLEVAGHFEFASPITAAKAQLLAMVMAVLWVRRFRSLPPGTTVAYITSNDSHVQMIRQGGMSESESLWNAIDFLQRAFQDQPELFGSRGMEASFCVAQRRRTEFLCSEKEGTARGTRGRFFRCVGLHSDITKIDHKRTHHTHKGKDARRSLDSGLPHSLRQSDRGRQRRERATRAVSKNKQGPSTQAAQAPPFFKGCGDRERCQFPFLWKDRIRRI